MNYCSRQGEPRRRRRGRGKDDGPIHSFPIFYLPELFFCEIRTSSPPPIPPLPPPPRWLFAQLRRVVCQLAKTAIMLMHLPSNKLRIQNIHTNKWATTRSCYFVRSCYSSAQFITPQNHSDRDTRQTVRGSRSGNVQFNCQKFAIGELLSRQAKQCFGLIRYLDAQLHGCSACLSVCLWFSIWLPVRLSVCWWRFVRWLVGNPIYSDN